MRKIPFDAKAFDKEYGGIGSRNITKKSSKVLFKVGFFMTLMGYKLHSGAADGSDTSFELGARAARKFLTQYNVDLKLSDIMSVFLPWNGFNGRSKGDGYIDFVHPSAEDFTSKFHQNWENLNQAVRKMMSRNAMQVLGVNLNKRVALIICETPDGAYTADMTSSKTGGTGQAIRIADHCKVRVFNIKNPEHMERIDLWINRCKLMWVRQCGVDPLEYVEKCYDDYKGFPSQDVEYGDIVDYADSGLFDVVIHGLSCQGKSGAGVARALAERFPELKEADATTKAGDLNKLGSYTSIDVLLGDGLTGLTVVNAYTQKFYGRDENVLYADYKAIKDVMEKINKDFRGKRIVLPKIGAGLANGCWLTISNIIRTELKDCDVTLVLEKQGV